MAGVGKTEGELRPDSATSGNNDPRAYLLLEALAILRLTSGRWSAEVEWRRINGNGGSIVRLVDVEDDVDLRLETEQLAVRKLEVGDGLAGRRTFEQQILGDPNPLVDDTVDGLIRSWGDVRRTLTQNAQGGTAHRAIRWVTQVRSHWNFRDQAFPYGSPFRNGRTLIAAASHNRERNHESEDDDHTPGTTGHVARIPPRRFGIVVIDHQRRHSSRWKSSMIGKISRRPTIIKKDSNHFPSAGTAA